MLPNVLGRSSADRMREMEKTQDIQWGSPRYKNKRSAIPFVCAAIAVGWKNKLGLELVAKIEAAWGKIMAQLGKNWSRAQRRVQRLNWQRRPLETSANEGANPAAILSCPRWLCILRKGSGQA